MRPVGLAMSTPNLIVFGGTFDPPHAGHAACLSGIYEAFPNARILVIPAAAPPPTAGKCKKPWLAFDSRAELCEIMVKNLGFGDRVFVSRIEESLSAPNYTVNTLEALHKENSELAGNVNMAITLGADQFAHFNTWRSTERILELADLIIVPRGDSAASQKIIPQVLANGRQPRIWALKVATSAASSSAIRTAIQNQQPVPRDWLFPEVLSRLQQLTSKAIETLPG